MVIDKALIQKYNKPGPRYTSYPPATYFEPLSPETSLSLIENSNESGRPISLYIHIPFCAKICHFCGCHTSPMQKKSIIDRYMAALKQEIVNTSGLLDLSRPVTQIHWGGGTPNAIELHYIAHIMQRLYKIFKIPKDAEIAMECNPAHLEISHIKELAEMGFNRLSLGVQDFDENVLRTINRDPSKWPVEELIKEMREYHFTGINLDLVYGLPGQTVESFTEAVRKAIVTNSDRIVTFSYAHVPWVKKAQTLLERIGLPDAETKLAMYLSAYELLTKEGYVAIGLDHFVKEDDELWIAQKNRMLHRNFQGYCSKRTTGEVYGFGCSSISQLKGGYIQNEKDMAAYMEAIETRGLASVRGYAVSKDEKIIGAVLDAIMCDGYLDFEEVASRFETSVVKLLELLNFREEKLEEFLHDELIRIDGTCIEVTERGGAVVRNIAMAFDPLIRSVEKQYSKTI